MEEKILKEITSFCEECSSHECCPEEECVLYRIEQNLTTKKYQVEIKEIGYRVINVEAHNEDEAFDIAEEEYRSGRIVFEGDDTYDYEISVIRSDTDEK